MVAAEVEGETGRNGSLGGCCVFVLVYSSLTREASTWDLEHRMEEKAEARASASPTPPWRLEALMA